MLIVCHIEIAASLIIKIQIVVSEYVRKPHTPCLYRVVNEIGTSHYTLAQPQRESGCKRRAGRRERAVYLQSHNLLGVEPHTQSGHNHSRAVLPAYLRQRVGQHGFGMKLRPPRHKRAVDAYYSLQSHELVPLPHGRLLATVHKRVDGRGRETCRRVARRIDTDWHVCHCQILVVLVLTVDVYNLHKHVRRALQVVSTLQIFLNSHSYHNVGTHLPRYVNGEIIAQSAIHEHHTVLPHRREHTRNCHARAHRLRKNAAVHDVFRIVNNIGCHARERYRQTVEIDGIAITCRESVEQFVEVTALNHSTLLVGYLVLAERERLCEEISVLPFAVVKQRTVCLQLVGEQERPVLHPHHRVESVGIVAYGVKSANDRTHRRSSDDVYRYARLLYHT